MSDDRRQFGQSSEEAAAELLRQHGYEIVKQNYRTKTGEIDIIAKDGETLVFVEVKARRSGSFGHPKYAVNYRKQQKISKTALWYMKASGQMHCSARFDVVSLIASGKNPRIEILKNAFALACP